MTNCSSRLVGFKVCKGRVHVYPGSAGIRLILNGLANNEDTDQEQSDLGLHCLHTYAISSDTLMHGI